MKCPRCKHEVNMTRAIRGKLKNYEQVRIVCVKCGKEFTVKGNGYRTEKR